MQYEISNAKLDLIRQSIENKILTESSFTERVPKFALETFSRQSTREVSLKILVVDELMEQILSGLKNDNTTPAAVEILESVVSDIAKVVFNALLDLTQLKQISITTTVSVTGYEGKES